MKYKNITIEIKSNNKLDDYLVLRDAHEFVKDTGTAQHIIISECKIYVHPDSRESDLAELLKLKIKINEQNGVIQNLHYKLNSNGK